MAGDGKTLVIGNPADYFNEGVGKKVTDAKAGAWVFVRP